MCALIKTVPFFICQDGGGLFQSAYRYDALYLTARQAGRIVGVLPIVDVKSSLLGRSLISMPFSVGGGPLADDDCALKALLTEAVSIGEKAGVKYLECRSNFVGGSDWIAKADIYAGFKTTLPSSEDDHLKAIPRKTPGRNSKKRLLQNKRVL